MPTQLDQDRTREALAEFEAEHDRIVEAEAQTSRTWSKRLVGHEARFTKTIILQERASERLRGSEPPRLGASPRPSPAAGQAE